MGQLSDAYNYVTTLHALLITRNTALQRVCIISCITCQLYSVALIFCCSLSLALGLEGVVRQLCQVVENRPRSNEDRPTGASSHRRDGENAGSLKTVCACYSAKYKDFVAHNF